MSGRIAVNDEHRHDAARARRTIRGIAALSIFTLVLAACAENGDGAAAPGDGGTQTARESGERPALTLASAEWSSAEASANLIKVVLEESLGYRVSIEYLPADEMWAALASGQADATLSAWLPVTHGEYAERHGDEVDDLGANLTGVRTGLVVPRVSVGRQTDSSGSRVEPYIPVTSIPELAEYAEDFGGRIIGIEPSAGVMQSARNALDEYGLADRYRLVEGTEERMIAALERAIRQQSWVVVTGWTPHWAFGQWELEFLDDPRNVFGSEEQIHTVVEPGLASEHPDAYELLDNFRWELEDIEQLTLWIHRDDGADPYAVAKRWAEAHAEKVSGWLPER